MAWRPKPGPDHVSDTPPVLDGPSHPHWPTPDRPITSANQDMLGRDRFAKRVAAVINEIRQVEASSVLAIVGPWGSGKSSVINLACAELKTLDSSWKVCPARIWASPDASGVIAEIFAAIRSALPDDRRASKALDLLGKYAPLVTPALSLVPVVGNLLQGLAGNATKLVASRQTQRPMQHLFDEITGELEKLRLRILVVLDDVDRLQPDELLVLFKAIRQVAPFPGVYYLLAYDEQTVVGILTDTPIAHHNQDRALAYLEKIVQVPLAMPPVEYYYARKLLTGGLNDTLLYPGWVQFTGEQESLFRELYDMMLQRTLAEPRPVNRFLRQVAAYLPLIDPAELDLVDLLTLIHLRSFAPTTHRLLARSKAALTSAEPAPDLFRQALDWCIQGECGDVRDEVQAALATLFPALQDNSGNVTSSIRVKMDFFARQKAKRVSVAEYFDRYFLLGLAITDVSDATARDALRAIARGEPSDALTTIEKRIDAEDPAAVSAALQKLARFTETDNLLDVVALGTIARYAIDRPGLWQDPALAEDIESWAAAALTRISRAAPPVVPGLTDKLDELGLLLLCRAVERAQPGIHDHHAGLASLRRQVASAVVPHIHAHLRKGNEALTAVPFVSFAAFVVESSLREECAQQLVADLDANEYTVSDLAARFVQVEGDPDGQEQVIGVADDPLIALVGLTALSDRCALIGNSAADVLSFDKHDTTWEGRQKAGLSLLTAELQKRRAVPPASPSGVLKRTEQSVLWDRGPRHWANCPELTPSPTASSRPLLCIRAAALLPGGSQRFPGASPTREIPDEQRAKVIQETLQKSLLTDWFTAMTHKFGVEAEPRWEETGYTNPSFAGFVLSRADPAESPWPLPLHAHCAMTSGPAAAGGTDGLALALDLLIDMPFPPEDATRTGMASSAAPTGLGPSVSPWPAPELESLSGLVQMMTNSVIPATRTAASQILNLDATDGNVGVWLATTTSFSEILALDQFPVVPGSGPGQNEVSVFARLPLEPGEHFGTGTHIGSVRGLAVHLIDQLLQQEQRRGYAETLHALRGLASPS
jgi:hypothetical protein